jgi:hypothetical protein
MASNPTSATMEAIFFIRCSIGFYRGQQLDYSILLIVQMDLCACWFPTGNVVRNYIELRFGTV